MKWKGVMKFYEVQCIEMESSVILSVLLYKKTK